ncbi:MAG: LysE family translocator [Acidimicrobiales bacterium]
MSATEKPNNTSASQNKSRQQKPTRPDGFHHHLLHEHAWTIELDSSGGHSDYLELMPSVEITLAFSAAALLILLLPGPAVLFVVSRGITQGSRGGLMSVAGLHLGSLVHVVAAAVGLSAVLVRSAMAFSTVKYAGAAYLVYLGIRTLRSRSTPPDVPVQPAGSPPAVSMRASFQEGLVVNLLNPKLALFFLAVLPQFVRTESGSFVGQILILGLIFIAIGFTTDSLYALSAARAAAWMRSRPQLAQRQRILAGCSYIGLGLLAAVSPRPNTLK